MEDSRNRFRSVQWDHYDEHQKYFELGNFCYFLKTDFLTTRVNRVINNTHPVIL